MKNWHADESLGCQSFNYQFSNLTYQCNLILATFFSALIFFIHFITCKSASRSKPTVKFSRALLQKTIS